MLVTMKNEGGPDAFLRKCCERAAEIAIMEVLTLRHSNKVA